MPLPRTRTAWCECPSSADERLRSVEADLRERGAVVVRGGDYDSWDLEVRGGGLGAARLLMLIEEHGAGMQFVRFRVYPRWPRMALGATGLLLLVSIAALLEDAWPVAMIIVVAAAGVALRALQGCAGATAALLSGLDRPRAASARQKAAIHPARANST
jgi:hypothetical protein